MEKKNRPLLQAANSDTRRCDVTPPADTVQSSKRTPKKHRARVYMLRTGVEGWTENDIPGYCCLSSGRDFASERECRLDIRLKRIDEKKSEGIGMHLRYHFVSRADVLHVIQLVNHNAAAGGYQGHSQPEITDILNLYPDTLTAA